MRKSIKELKDSNFLSRVWVCREKLECHIKLFLKKSLKPK